MSDRYCPIHGIVSDLHNCGAQQARLSHSPPSHAPELPEGFTGNGPMLYDPDGRVVARWYGELGGCGISGAFVAKQDAQALAIWLQRKAVKPPETGTQTSEENK